MKRPKKSKRMPVKVRPAPFSYSPYKKSLELYDLKRAFVKKHQVSRRPKQTHFNARLDALLSSMSHLSIRRDYSTFDKTLQEMIDLPRLSGARNQYDCVIYSMYCVGLIQRPFAEQLAQSIITQQRTYIDIPSIIEFLERELQGTVEHFMGNVAPFYWFEQHSILENGEVMLLGYARKDNTGHMVVVGKQYIFYIYDKQNERVYRIDEFLASEPNIATFYLFKITR